MPVSIDLTELHAMLAAAEELRDVEVPQILEAVVDTGAAYERSNHDYQDRTRALTRSTKGVWVRQSRNERIRNLEAGAPYAGYVRKRGLMEIDQAAAAVEVELQVQFDALEVK